MTIITSRQFATALGISERAARKAFSAGQYRGEALPLCKVEGQRGGAGGHIWGLALDATSPALRARLLGALPDLEQVVEHHCKATFQPRQFAGQAERLTIIRAILTHPKGSPERAAAYRAAASVKHMIGGRLRSLAEPTLREWVRTHEEKGVSGLLPSQRSDKGRRRVMVSRAWDKGIDLPDDRKAELAATLATWAQSLIANDGTPDREVIRLAGHKLQRLSAEAGSQLTRAALKRICVLTTKWVKPFAAFRLAHMEAKDHGAWQDRAVPRIRRELHERPMGCLIGDVHYMDLLVAEHQEPVRVRLVGWMDASSLFIWITPIFLPKGKGATQEDIARSLAQVTFGRHGGLAESYYLDNGSEFAELPNVTERMSALAAMAGGFRVELAKPFSPQSKGDIENAFRILQGIYAGLPGFIGGDRTNKKSTNKGQVVAPYRRGLDQLADDIAAVVAIYNDRPQSGRLRGLSPLQALEEKIAATGFVARVPDEEAFDVIFSRAETRTLRQGMIHLDGRQFHAPFLYGMPEGARFEVLRPLRARDSERVFLRQGGRDLGWAEAEATYRHGDAAGARRQSELEAGRRQAVRKMRALTDPSLSTFAEQKAAVSCLAPNAPAPEAWSRAIDKTQLPPSAADDDKVEDARRRALLNELLSPSGASERRGASGGHR